MWSIVLISFLEMTKKVTDQIHRDTYNNIKGKRYGYNCIPLGFSGGSSVKNLPAMQETRVRSVGRESPLEEGMATHSIILAWRIPWTKEPGGLQSMGLQELDLTWRLSHHYHHHAFDCRHFKLSFLTLVSWVNSMMGHWVITLSWLTSVFPSRSLY